MQRLAGHRLGPQSREGVDRRLHLLDVGDAPVAHHQVLLDLAEGRLVERTFEVVGDELDELLAGDLVCSQVVFAGRVPIWGP